MMIEISAENNLSQIEINNKKDHLHFLLRDTNKHISVIKTVN